MYFILTNDRNDERYGTLQDPVQLSEAILVRLCKIIAEPCQVMI